MDSPVDVGSPGSNSSDDVPQDDLMAESSQGQELFGQPLRDVAAGSSSAKRRQPPGGFPPGLSYGVKSRRREEGPVRRTTSNTQWAGGDVREGGRNQKDELVDVQIVERLREDWGDPFDDTFIKTSS